MKEQPLSFSAQVRSYPRTFWVANTMEIFERTAWYGMFTLLALYLTDSRAHNGLGLTEEDAGVIIGITTFILYMLPILTGALADRYGYKKMFVLAYGILTPSYWMLGRYETFWTFLFGFLLLAVGAAIFKPVVVGTVARTTNQTNSQLGFGFFYMIVNIGGFVGPLVTGLLRAPDPATGASHWSRVFTCSGIAIAINFFWVLFFFKEPTTEAQSGARRTLRKVLTDAVEVLGNVRFFLCIFGIIIAFFAAGKNWVSWRTSGLFSGAWLIVNLAYDVILRASRGGRRGDASGVLGWAASPMRLTNWRFALYLLILSGFWTSFNQISGAAVTLVWYVRDFVETRPLFHAMATGLNFIGLSSWAQELTQHAEAGGQVNPEWIVNLNPLAIVFCQIVVSLFVSKVGRFPGMIMGVVVTGLGIAIPALAGAGTVGVLHASGWLVALGVVVFSFGEMAASPTSQEYIGTLAPPDKVALYMGYYFVCIALGNLFGNVLAGQLYGVFARDRGMPHVVWLIFGGVSFVTALALGLYNRYAVPRRPTAQPVPA